ncbi:MAG TPA: hypothetical protein VJS91_03965 [Nitrososphaeraceae archaeon]|nr:hypothetical protein [Nitrososphaeraceae archaeon]
MYFIFTNAISFAQSPSAYQEIKDRSEDWVDAIKLNATSGIAKTDILSVNIFSNGKILNATIWLSDSLYDKWFLSYSNKLTYGMYIDADSNIKTGIEGIDYNTYITNENSQSKEKNLSKVWTKKFEQWSSVLPLLKNSQKRMVHEEKNFTGFFAEGKKFVQLSFDLSAIGSPGQFRILFYTIEKEYGKPWIVDFTNWINFPPPNISISVQPENLELSPGDNKTLEIKLKSNAKFTPTVKLYTNSLPSGLATGFAYDKLDIPTFGEATTTMWIKATDPKRSGPYTVAFFTNSSIQKTSIPAQENTTVNTISAFQKPEVPKIENENIENFTTVSSFVIFIQPSIPILQQIRDVVSEWQWIIAIAIGILVDRFIPWENVLSSIRKLKRS